MRQRSIRSRAALDDGLVALQHDLRSLATLVDVAVDRSVAALGALDRASADAVIAGDRRINELRFVVEDRAIHLIATQQPIAGDLRTIIAVLYVVVELERMGDYCAGIAKLVLLHGDRPLLKPLVDVPRMAVLVRELLGAAIEAFVARDAAAAERVAARDAEIDRLYARVYEELVGFMRRDPESVERATWLIWVAHNLERMGDRIQNVCERTVYEATGVMREFSTPSAVPPTEG